MILPITGFYILCVVLVILLLTPFLYFEFIKKSEKKILFILPALVVPFVIFTPYIVEVEDCDSYNEKAVILPEGEFTRGRGYYLVNKSQNTLYITPIVYGSAITDAETIYCTPGETIKYTEAIHYILEEAPDSIMLKDSHGAVRYLLGCIPSYEEQLKISLANVEDSLKQNPDDVTYLFYKGSLLHSLGKTAEADESFQKAIQADKKAPVRSLFAAYSYGRLEQWEPAIAIYKQYLDSTTFDEKSYIYSNLGFCYIGAGDAGKAKISFTDAITELEENIMAYLGLAMIAAGENDLAAVKKNLDTLWQLRPDYPHSYEAVNMIEEEGAYFSPVERDLLQRVFAMYEENK